MSSLGGNDVEYYSTDSESSDYWSYQNAPFDFGEDEDEVTFKNYLDVPSIFESFKKTIRDGQMLFKDMPREVQENDELVMEALNHCDYYRLSGINTNKVFDCLLNANQLDPIVVDKVLSLHYDDICNWSFGMPPALAANPMIALGIARRGYSDMWRVYAQHFSTKIFTDAEVFFPMIGSIKDFDICLLYTSPSPRDS